jgi:hypothetical protein
MRYTGICLLVLMVVATFSASAQDHPFTVAVGGSLSTSSELFPHTDNSDETIRNQFLPLDDLFGVSLDIRRQFDAIGIQMGLSVEYVSKTESSTLPISSARSVPVADGFTVVPIELTGYFTIPIGNEMFRVYMGGGGGVYVGTRTYTIATANALTVSRTAQAGIHVLGGFEYACSPMLVIRSEIKFRDVQFETVNQFEQLYVPYRGTIVTLDQQPLASRVSINGMVLGLALGFRF